MLIPLDRAAEHHARACGCRQRRRRRRKKLIEAQRWWSGRETLVTMMQAAGLGQGNDPCGSRKFMRLSGGSNDAVHGPLGSRLSRPVRVDGQVGRRVNPSPRIGAGAIRGNKRNNHGESV